MFLRSFLVFFLFAFVLATSPLIRPTKNVFWHIGSIWHRKSKKMFLKFFDELRAFFCDFWRFYRFFHLMYIAFGIGTRCFENIGPLLDDGLKWGTPKALKGLPLSLLFCLCVCLLPSYRPQFSTQQPNFLKIYSLGLWEKRFFSVFRNFDFWPFEGPFSAIFEYFLLYPL